MKNTKKNNNAGKRVESPEQKLLGAFDLPFDASGRLPYITLTGSGHAEICCHCGVLQLSKECVRLYTRAGIVRIEGREIVVSSMDNERISLSGKICSVAFE